MRCVHCGREARKNTIFCMNCGRPIKHEYRNYTCEIYEGNVFWEKLDSLLESLKGLSVPKNVKHFSNLPSSRERALLKNLSAFRDLSALKEFPLFKNFNPAKTFSLILAVIAISVPLLTNFISDITSEYQYDTYDIEQVNSIPNEYWDYELPIEPSINPAFAELTEDGQFGSEKLIINYLQMLYQNTVQMSESNEVVYTIDELNVYRNEINQIKEDYSNNYNYYVFDELIYISDLWTQTILPIQENNDQYSYKDYEEDITYFFDELKMVCDYYFVTTDTTLTN